MLAACGERTGRAPVLDFGTKGGGATSAGVHTVSENDTVWQIAKRYQLDMKSIISVNNLSPPYTLKEDQRLTLPPPTIYKVKQGDTLYNIARMFDVSQNSLARQNNMRAPFAIEAGQSIRLPSIAVQKPQNVRVASRPPQNLGRASVKTTKQANTPPPSRAARAASPSKPTPKKAGKFTWPVDGAVISRYGPKKDGLHNDGINIRAPRGTPVRAAENGVVAYADNQLKGFGNLVLVRHQDRWMTAYAHLENSSVNVGDAIKQGQVIGTVGSSGNVDSPQLHFEIRRGTDALNPSLYLPAQGS
jgi:murein DD-endopeptidase MepM/ murein hydrolase activator NlpD